MWAPACSCAVFRAESVVADVVLVQTHDVQQAAHEHLHARADLGDAVHADGVRLVPAFVDGVVPAVPVGVLLQQIGLVALEFGEAVRTEGHGGFLAGAVGVVVNAVRRRFTGVVQRLVDEPVIGEGVIEIETGERLGQDEDERVIVRRLDADFVEVHRARELHVGHEQLVVGPLDHLLVAGPGGVRAALARGVEGVELGEGQRRLHDGVLGFARPGLRLEVIGVAEGVAPVDAAGLFAVLGQQILDGELLRAHDDGERGVAGDALFEVGFRVLDDEVAAVEHVGAVVLRLGIQQQLRAGDEIPGGDGRAVLPGQIVAQGDLPGAAFLALGDVPVPADVIGGHVDREVGGGVRYDLVAVLFVVVIEGVQPVAQVGHELAVDLRLVLVRAPVGGKLRLGGVVGVDALAVGQRGRGEQRENEQKCQYLLGHEKTSLFS